MDNSKHMLHTCSCILPCTTCILVFVANRPTVSTIRWAQMLPDFWQPKPFGFATSFLSLRQFDWLCFNAPVHRAGIWKKDESNWEAKIYVLHHYFQISASWDSKPVPLAVLISSKMIFESQACNGKFEDSQKGLKYCNRISTTNGFSPLETDVTNDNPPQISPMITWTQKHISNDLIGF